MDVICIGLTVFDIIVDPVTVKTLVDDSTYLDTLNLCVGGDALNVAVNLSTLGLKTMLIGRIGDDLFGKHILETIAGYGVNSKHMIVDRSHVTSTSIVMVDEKSERHFAYYGKTNNHLCFDDIDFSLLEPPCIVYIGSAMALAALDGDGLERLFREAKARGCITAMDVTWDREDIWLPKIEKALRYTDVFLPSLNEAYMLTGAKELAGIKNFFVQYGIKALAVKMGEKGCFVTDFNKEYQLPAMLHDGIKDTNGAGDAFVSGFLLGFYYHYDIRSCAMIGSRVAMECLKEYGATTGVIKAFSSKEKCAALLDIVNN